MKEPDDDFIVPESSYAFEFITDQPRMTVDITARAVMSRGTIGLTYADLSLNYSRGGKVVIFDITTDDDGDFTHLFLPNQVGEWEVVASFAGDEVNWPSDSNVSIFTVRCKPTTLNLNKSRDWIGLGDYVNVTGQFSEKRAGYERAQEEF